MPNPIEAVNASGRHDHLVQFYSSPETLAETAGHFISEGLRKGETVVVIATPGHSVQFDAAMAAAGIDLAAVRANGRLVEFDARRTLDSLMSEGQPVWHRFQSTIGPVLDKAVARGGGVRAYGEMVDILWQAGNLSAAIRLEGYWNQILAKRRVPLFCAYRASVLGEASNHSPLQNILIMHTQLIPGRGDLEAAVNRAIEEDLGVERASVLRPLIAATQTAGAKLPWAEAAVFWLKNNLPDRAERVIGRARVILGAESAPA